MSPDEPLLRADGIVKTFRRGFGPWRRVLRVLRGAGLRLDPGEVVGLVGENGSGKSTMMKILSGALSHDGGEVRRLGRIGYCPQEPILYERLTCNEHFELFGRAYGLARSELDVSRTSIYETLGFGSWAGARVEELSGGTRGKLNLGLALLADPEVLLLDEPYAGFDWETYQRFWALAEDRKASGRAILVISHFVTDEDRFDRIYHMENGRSVER
ncbi:MAG TPA: ABC transporter ATP-binding protein [Actinomycetota bacterium]